MEKEIDMEEQQPTADLIKHALDQDFNKANEIFGNIMGQKVNDMLDQEKVKMADQIYNDGGEQLELPLGDENGEADEEEAEASSEPVADTESGDEEIEDSEEESSEDVEVEVDEDDTEEEEISN